MASDVITKTKISRIDSLPYFLTQSVRGAPLLFTKVLLLPPKFIKSPMILSQYVLIFIMITIVGPGMVKSILQFEE